jgi:hypothetical protein
MARKDFAEQRHLGGYTNHTQEYASGSHRSPSTITVMKFTLQQTTRAYLHSILQQGLEVTSYRTDWSTRNTLQLVVFRRCTVRNYARTQAVMRFSWLSSNLPQANSGVVLQIRCDSLLWNPSHVIIQHYIVSIMKASLNNPLNGIETSTHTEQQNQFVVLTVKGYNSRDTHLEMRADF